MGKVLVGVCIGQFCVLDRFPLSPVVRSTNLDSATIANGYIPIPILRMILVEI